MGAAMTGLINEGKNPNVIIYKNFYVTIREVVGNEQLNAHYGPDYDRQHYNPPLHFDDEFDNEDLDRVKKFLLEHGDAIMAAIKKSMGRQYGVFGEIYMLVRRAA